MSEIISTVEAITKLLFIDPPSVLRPVDLLFDFGNKRTETMQDVKDLYDRGIVKKHILITGHSYNATEEEKETEARIFMKRGIELGIPEEVFILEEEAGNTKENVDFSLPIIQQKIGLQSVKSIMFVCKAFHTRRVLMTFQQSLKCYEDKHPNDKLDKIECLFFPVGDERDIKKDNWWLIPAAKERVLAEVQRIAEYTLKGDLSLL